MGSRSGAAPQGGCGVRRWRLRLLASLVVMAFIGSAPGSAAAFGTIDTGGQRREHERVTRAALSCAGEAHADEEPALKRRRARQPRSTAAVELHHYRRMSAPAKTASKAVNLLSRRERARVRHRNRYPHPHPPAGHQPDQPDHPDAGRDRAGRGRAGPLIRGSRAATLRSWAPPSGKTEGHEGERPGGREALPSGGNTFVRTGLHQTRRGPERQSGGERRAPA